jgi:hypothetical protein
MVIVSGSDQVGISGLGWGYHLSPGIAVSDLSSQPTSRIAAIITNSEDIFIITLSQNAMTAAVRIQHKKAVCKAVV